ncbi:UPF0225 protein [Thalassotalea insulae]|uniref:UPF0225 protein n=1 Tax=Thalassotalea insulae TaxID=2056778 RepID=A0ABQ6GQ51_9GAMM|nr:YchJ family protein [Thalassotalea insulae]GLX76835.1 UPF0225 protein [Thalassotalea insulae]
MSCYCGNKNAFEQCCLPIILGNKLASTPEQLMRSRYSAYAARYPQYIYDSYACEPQKNQSLDEITQWAEQTLWLKLTIVANDTAPLDSIKHSEHENLPKVHFKALYLDGKQFCLMEEISRFIKENGQWRYLDGDIIYHEALPTPKRNAPCLCLSGKKFKHCCALKY